jgi:DNA repair exonuclease SbcCD ATPase subunit
MSEDQYISEEREEEPAAPTEVTDSEVFTGKMTPVEETTAVEKMIPLEESPAAFREEKLQEQKREIEQALEESSFRKKKQKRRRTTSYLSQILKHAEKNGGEINKIKTSIESLQKQQRLAAVGQSQSIKQILSQFSQLQKRVTGIQKDVQRIRSVPAAKTKIGKVASITTSKPKSKKSKSVSSTKVRRRT